MVNDIAAAIDAGGNLTKSRPRSKTRALPLEQAWIALGCLWMMLAALGPNLRSFGALNLRPEDLLTLLMLGLGLLQGVARGSLAMQSRRLLRLILWVGFLFACVGAFALLATSLFGGGTAEGAFGYGTLAEAAKEAVRWLKFAGVVLAFGFISRRGLRPALTVIILSSLIMVALQLAQYAGVRPISDWLRAIYVTSPTDVILAASSLPTYRSIGQWRSGSVMVNPNVMAAYLVLPMLILWVRLVLTTRTPFGKVARDTLPVIFALSMLGVGLILTQSKAGLLMAAFGGLLCVWWLLRLGRINGSGAFRLLVAGGLLLALVFAVAGSRLGRINLSGGAVGLGQISIGTKADLTLSTLAAFRPWQVLIGLGPGNVGQIDNELGYFVGWYGLLGLVIYGLLIWRLYRLCAFRTHDALAGIALRAVLLTYVVASIAGSYVLNNRVFPTYLAVLALAIGRVMPPALWPSVKTIDAGSPAGNLQTLGAADQDPIITAIGEMS